MARLVKLEPKGEEKRPNSFEGITKLSLRRRLLEWVIEIGALITVYEFIMRVMSG
jgi:hypothetical protein